MNHAAGTDSSAPGPQGSGTEASDRQREHGHPSESRSLLDLLAWRARFTGDRPWLFFRRGWDWRWWSWNETWNRAAEMAEALGPPSGARRRAVMGSCVRVGAPGVGEVDAPVSVAVDLGILLVGGVPFWQTGSRAEPAPFAVQPDGGSDHGWRLERAASESGWSWLGPEPADSLPELPTRRPRVRWRRPAIGSSGHPRAAPGAGAPESATDHGGNPDVEDATLDEVAELARGLDSVLGPVSAESRTRKLLGLDPASRVGVDSGDLGTASSRVAWAWSIATGGALLLPPSPAAWLDSVLWSRPTDLWGSSEQLLELDRACSTRSGRRALARLRAFAVLDASAGESARESTGRSSARSPSPALDRLGVSVVRHPLASI